MLASLLAIVVSCTPQDAPRPRVSTTTNGWPVEARPGTVPPASVGGAGPAQQEARGRLPEPGGLSAEGRALPAASSPLLAVFRAVGAPGDAAALRGVRARLKTTIYDHRGGVVGERECTHEADLSVVSRDRLLFGGDTIYGRDGATVFAHYRGLAFPNLEVEARDDLAWHGLVLRVPWVFADESRYTVSPREDLLWNNRPMSRFRITSTITRDDRGGAADQFELWCDPDTSEPRLLLITPADPAARPCRVRFLEFQSFGNARVPLRRLLESREGSRLLEIELADVAVQQTYGPRYFAAPAK